MEFWFLFPVGVLVAAVAMSSGISGANFWIPVYLLWLQLEPRVAFWMSLFTTLFGFGSGLVGNFRAGTYDLYLVGRYLLMMVPAAVCGALVAARLDASFLLIGFAAFVLIYGGYLLVESVRGRSHAGGEEAKHQRVFWLVGGLAGLLQGTIATGSGTLLLPCLLNHQRSRHHAVAVGSTVMLVFAGSLVSVAFRVDPSLFGVLVEKRSEILAMIAFAGPGVIVGGQLGPRIARWLPRRYLRLYLAVLLLLVGVLVAQRAVGVLN